MAAVSCQMTVYTKLFTPSAIKTLEQFNYDFAKGAKRSQLEELAGLGFIERNENVVLVGT